MKLPFTIKVPDMGGLLSRLNPKKLFAKKDKSKDEDGLPDHDDDGDLFGDLGDLDQLDAEAQENEASESSARADDGLADEIDDLDPLDDEPDVLDEVDAPDEPDFADLDAEDAAAPSEGGEGGGADLVAEIMGDIEEDFELSDDFGEDEDEDEEEAKQKAKLKKLGLLAGGGVAAAVLLGGVAWWLLGSDAPAPETAQETAPVVQSSNGGVVINLDSLPPAPVREPATEPAPAPREQAAPSSPPAASSQQPTQSASATSSEDEPDNRSRLQKLGLDVEMEPGVGVVIPASTPTSFAQLPTWPAGEALTETPYEALVQQGEHGILPRIGQDGTTPYDAYRRPEPAETGEPKVAIIVTGLGLSRAATEAAIQAMPQDVAMSLDVYSRGLDFWVKSARQDGHEVLLEMPGESADFPFSDPGPSALQSLVAPEENLARLHWILSQASGYFGVLSTFGSKFLSVEEQLQVVMEELNNRGLMYVDGGAQDSLGPRVAYNEDARWATVELVLDERPGRKALQIQLSELENLARKRAQAVARVSTNPASLEEVSKWLRTLDDKGITLVPVSALANKQLIR